MADRLTSFMDLLRLIGRRDRLRLLLVKLGMRIPGLSRRLRDRPVPLRLRPLAGAPFHVRPGHQDLATVAHAFLERQHRPPDPVAGEDLGVICELGANVGASMAALATEYPNATVLAVEPDPGNAAIARLNAGALGSRCSVVELAIWDRECDLLLGGPASDALVARDAGAGATDAAAVRATTIDRLLEEQLPGRTVDFLHMCIEGTEPRVLDAAGAWPERVRSLRVELYPHRGFGGPECVAALDRLGYDAWYEEDQRSMYGFGVRG